MDPRAPDPVSHANLHSDAQASLTSLPDRALRYAHTRTILTTTTALTLALVAATLLEGRPRMALVVLGVPVIVLLGVLDALLFNPLQHRWTGYYVKPEAINLATGRLFRSVTTIDGTKVLAIDVTQGPLLRSMGLAVVRFRCLTEMPALGPIGLAEAERIRSALIDVSSSPKDADVAH